MKKILIDDSFKLKLKIRKKETHKGNDGKVLIIGGSNLFAGTGYSGITGDTFNKTLIFEPPSK